MSGARHERRRAGMTLVETMISIAILAMIMTMVWGGFSQTAKNKEAIEREIDRYHVVRISLERMVRELSTAYVSAHVNQNPSLQAVQTAFVGTDRRAGARIDFTSFSHRRLYRDAHESDQNEISYFITRHPDHPDRRVLARREDNRVDDDPRRGGRVQIMIEDIEDFELEYYDPIAREWQDTWDTTQLTAQPNRLPTQVKISITLPDTRRPGREVVFGTRASIPITWALNHAIYNP